MKILITGVAGFIGSHTVKYYAERGNRVIGIDNIDSGTDARLKYARLKELGIPKELIQEQKPVQSIEYPNFRFFKADLQNKEFLDDLFGNEHIDVVCHLAAQTGNSSSMENPKFYIDSNIIGFFNVLEACRIHPVNHLVYASSACVYGMNKKSLYKETEVIDSPASLYAASKKSNELMAHSYSNLYKIPTTGIRFFTVYGPWGRPDTTPVRFMKSIIDKSPIKLTNQGKPSFDLIYIDDAISGLTSIVDAPSTTSVPYKIYNVGNGISIRFLKFIASIEDVSGCKAIKEPVEESDSYSSHSYADITSLERDFNYIPKTTILEGISKMYDWYVKYSKLID